MDWTHKLKPHMYENKMRGEHLGKDKLGKIEDYRQNEQDKGITSTQEYIREMNRLENVTERRLEGGRGETRSISNREEQQKQQ